MPGGNWQIGGNFSIFLELHPTGHGKYLEKVINTYCYDYDSYGLQKKKELPDSAHVTLTPDQLPRLEQLFFRYLERTDHLGYFSPTSLLLYFLKQRHRADLPLTLPLRLAPAAHDQPVLESSHTDDSAVTASYTAVKDVLLTLPVSPVGTHVEIISMERLITLAGALSAASQFINSAILKRIAMIHGQYSQCAAVGFCTAGIAPPSTPMCPEALTVYSSEYGTSRDNFYPTHIYSF